ncbi:hypothetical protein ACFSLT_20160 [Novosphingobium resinovorum]
MRRKPNPILNRGCISEIHEFENRPVGRQCSDRFVFRWHRACREADAAPASDAGAKTPASDIVVTGVRGAPRTVAESPAPIDVVGGEKLAGTGAAEFGEALTKILPSLNFSATHAGSIQ